VLGQRPARLALQPGQHPAQAGTGPESHLPAEEPARDQRERVIKPGPQPGGLNIVYSGQRGRPGFFSSNTPDASQWRPVSLWCRLVPFYYQPVLPSADKITICGWRTSGPEE
jgi:hypothetical protein